MSKKILQLISCSMLLVTTMNSYAICADESVVASTTAHLEVNPNNAAEIIDNKTGLIWWRCSLGQGWDGTTCSGSVIQIDWQSALSVAESVGSGWRLPNIKELNSIVEQRCRNPAIDTGLFPNTPGRSYWSSSPYAPASSAAQAVDFGFGNDSALNKSIGRYVRLVRSGQ